MNTHWNQILLFTISILFSMTSLQAQSPDREIGLRMAGLNDFGFIYKKQKSENRWRRFDVSFLNAGYSLVTTNDPDGDDTNLVSYGLGFGYGTENRIPINDKLLFVHGLGLGLNINGSVNFDAQSTYGFTPSIGYILGFQYNFDDNFYVSLETIPTFSVAYNLNVFKSDTEPDLLLHSVSTGFGFDQNAISLTLAYRFAKKGSEGG